MIVKRTILLIVCIVAASANAEQYIPSFPGAEGFGSRTPGGRGGVVIPVTNLNDSGPGSLRFAIEAKGRRIVIFRVGGTIRLKSHLRIEHPFITIAGQSAPGGGILIRDAGLYVSTHDVIVRFIRVRIGASTVEKYDTQDCIHIGDGAGVHDVIVDHCSFSWSIDEIASAVSSAHDVTFQWCIFAEALEAPLKLHKKRDHAYCLMLGNYPNHVSVHHNLLAHCEHRNPRIQGGTHDFVNNVVYNWGYFSAVFSRDPNTNFVGNYYKPGPESRICLPLEEKPGDLGKVFVKGNISVQRPHEALDDWRFTVGVAPGEHRALEPFKVVGVHTTDAGTAYKDVLRCAGAKVPALDAVDERILNEVVSGTGMTIDRPEEVGGFPIIANGTADADSDADGMPDAWERKHGCDPKNPSDGRGDRDNDGYTNLEEYLNSLASRCFPKATPPAGATLESLAIAFDSRQIPGRPHPFLFVTPNDIRTARRQIKLPAFEEAGKNLNDLADAAGEVSFESIDNAWWRGEKEKSWHDTYPIIFEKTCLQPLRMVHPAYNAALRFAITRDERDAAVAKKLLLHLADYTFEYEHYDVGMNYAVWGHMVLNTYDILFEHFTGTERSKLDAFFTRMARAILKNDIYWIENNIGGGINNHLAWHKMMLGALGLYYNRVEMVEYALHGPRGVVGLLDDGLVDDGLWCESSLNYHFTAIVPMVYLANALRNTDYREDLYTLTTPGRRNLKQPFDAMFETLFADGTIPPIGDTYGIIKKLSGEATYRYAQKAYGDRQFAWLLRQAPAKRPASLFIGSDTENTAAPKIASRLYPEHGYGFLRSRTDADYWNSDAWCAFLNFDKSGVHNHQDKLSLMLFGCGKLLTPDVASRATAAHAFSAKVQRELNRSALSQNTVMIDYRSQRGIPHLLSLKEFRGSGDEQRMTATDETGALYDGVKQSRTVILTNDYVLDVFQVVADKTHTIDWITHTIGTCKSLKTSVTLKDSAAAIPEPGNWLQDLKEAHTDKAIQVDCREDGVNFRMMIAAQPQTRLMVCGYPKTDKPDTPLTPMILVERKAAATIYAVLYQVGRNKLDDIQLTLVADSNDSIIAQTLGPWGKRRHAIRRLR